ncbi:aminoacyltransferase [Staphylococcus gallinarum]|jgi:peptidoglycan pentaglycine glycine transferase (the second and third glycine)|uniref:aminoacyltransferase n=1 Tax=Staphylococcus gallinarum TaxID=1293 RepID=UPI000D1D9EF9|nr:aminoacyltransferase [Staphylococcus gallinarum]MCD8820239.1 aminoacyltransferase [Staphylococcus gallinarum]PTL05810.1 aminoacyltransferase [Staphylococcus gallinarum]PTL10788.1 aminoacyltransferase [Staphylococcus gallinarum]RIL28957.1 aminoacyltransferase [Staphylococcus gallinarum]RIO75479.1 aminoacyltransferase [Staphylococcus gallinarum]
MKFTNLTAKEFGTFTDSMPNSHFTQMVGNYELKIAEGTETHLVGIKNNENEVIAACLLTAVPVMNYFKYFYTNRGPVIDFENKELVHYFFNELSKYVKKHRALYLRVDPYLPYQYRNHDGDVLENAGHDWIFDKMKHLGYKHQGFLTGFDPVVQIRFHSVLDLKDKTDKDVLKDMDGLRKRNTKKVQKNGVKVRFLGEDELPIFRAFMEDTSETKAFEDRDDSFYYNRLKYYKNRVLVPLAYMDFDEYIEELTAEREVLSKDINKALKDIEKRPENKKAYNKRDNLEKQLIANQQKIDEAKALQEQHGNELPISAAFFIINPYEVVYYAGGTSNEFRHFAGSYAVQWTMINYALDNNIDRYNFYGISGDFTEDAEDAGVVKFKKGFNADVIEYVGDFIKPINKPAYKIYTALKKLKDIKK